MPIDLYFVPPSPPCRAVIMAARHLNIELNAKFVDLMKGEQKEEWFLKINPQHCLPTIDDNGFILWESRAIMTYFANKYAPDSPIYPSNPQERAVVDRVLQFDLGTFYRSLGEYLVPILREGKTLDNLDPEKEKKVKEALQLLDDSLVKHTYVAGDKLTLADLSILASLTFAEVFDYDVSGYKNVKSWSDRLKRELPYYDEVNTEPITMFKSYVKVKTGERKPE